MHHTQVMEPPNSKRYFYRFAACKLASRLRAPPLVDKTRKAPCKCYRNYRTAGMSGPGLGKAVA